MTCQPSDFFFDQNFFFVSCQGISCNLDFQKWSNENGYILKKKIMILLVPFFFKFSCTVSFLTKTQAGVRINLSHFSEIVKFSEHFKSSWTWSDEVLFLQSQQKQVLTDSKLHKDSTINGAYMLTITPTILKVDTNKN